VCRSANTSWRPTCPYSDEEDNGLDSLHERHPRARGAPCAAADRYGRRGQLEPRPGRGAGRDRLAGGRGDGHRRLLRVPVRRGVGHARAAGHARHPLRRSRAPATHAAGRGHHGRRRRASAPDHDREPGPPRPPLPRLPQPARGRVRVDPGGAGDGPGPSRGRAQRAHPQAARVRRERGGAALGDRRAGRPGDRERQALRAVAAAGGRARGAGRDLAVDDLVAVPRRRPARHRLEHEPGAARTGVRGRAGGRRRAGRRVPVGDRPQRGRADCDGGAGAVCLRGRGSGAAAVEGAPDRGAGRGERRAADMGRRGALAARNRRPPGRRGGRVGPHRAAGAARPGDPPPGQEQPADRGVAAAAAARVGRRPRGREGAAREREPHLLDRRGARPADLLARGRRRLCGTDRPPAGDAGQRPGRPIARTLVRDQLAGELELRAEHGGKAVARFPAAS
jgi:hypothetical protein